MLAFELMEHKEPLLGLVAVVLGALQNVPSIRPIVGTQCSVFGEVGCSAQ